MPRANTSKTKMAVKDGSGLMPIQKESLLSLMLDKLSIEKEIEEKGGNVENGLDVIWLQKDVAVKEKVDSYGYLLDEIEEEISKLSQLTKKIHLAETRIETLKHKLKLRLNFFAQGNPLRGTIYSFHPYTSEHKYIKDTELLTPSESYLTVEVKKDSWIKLLNSYIEANGYPITEVDGAAMPVETESGLSYTIKSTYGKVSELPEGHPAIGVEKQLSVRIT